MAKQIKIGFDKTSSRSTTFDQILVDVRGNLLRDDRNEFLYTETEQPSPLFFRAENALSTTINNEATNDPEPGGSLAVEEQFPQTSEVSNSLLGVPRANEQQSLLSDVSVYGIDENTWEFFRNPRPFQPEEWVTRKNSVYGNRGVPFLRDYADQQALGLVSYPVAYTYPFGPLWESQDLYDPIKFTRYLRFVEMGNILYDYFLSRGYKSFADKNFLPRNMAEVDGIIFSENSQGADVIYNENLEEAFAAIENWTVAWMDIRDGVLRNPIDNRFLSAVKVDDIVPRNYDFVDTTPGYDSRRYYYSQLQSKESFRYQPGAISGFTFGVKMNADPARNENVIEWGCGNETDQLMFQVRGSNLNIVRRSTVPLSQQALEKNGLSQNDQEVKEPPNPFERSDTTYTSEDIGVDVVKPEIYETVISSDFFNGDPLNGGGPSGYNISFNEVTMYKIEYSWYGAIGAKFYAYIPVGNDDARWVLLHTLLIENLLDKPSLQNPFMHFRYSVYLQDTSSLREPLYLFKYGASYYIDGADEGTFAYNNYKLDIRKDTTSVNSKPIAGFLPKDNILNRDGYPVPSQKNFYIDDISVNTDKNIRLDVLECEGCKGGFGHYYAPSLVNGQRTTLQSFRISDQGELEYDDNVSTFNINDSGKKIIGNGIYSAYIINDNIVGEEESIPIKRKVRGDRINTIPSEPYTNETKILVDGEEISPIGYRFDGRITGYDDIIASSIPLRKRKIRVHFLNPISTDSLGHFNEFLIGITPNEPAVEVVDEETNEEKLLFNGEPLNIDDEIHAEFSQYYARLNQKGVEVGEWEPRTGIIMGQDYRLPIPAGVNSGICSQLNFDIEDLEIPNIEFREVLEVNGQTITGNFIVFTSNPNLDIIGGELGIYNGNFFEGSGVEFITNAQLFTEDAIEKYYAEIDEEIDLSSSVKDGSQVIAFKTIRCYGRFINTTKIYNFNQQTFYLFFAMRDNAVINNIVVEEFDESGESTHTPDWLFDPQSNIAVENVSVDELFDEESGKFFMGGLSFQGTPPSNFQEKKRLDSIRFDDDLELPLRPANFKSSFYVSPNKTENIDMSHLFGIDRFKVTKGEYNNKSVYISAVVTDEEQTGNIDLSINGREQ